LKGTRVAVGVAVGVAVAVTKSGIFALILAVDFTARLGGGYLRFAVGRLTFWISST
jgi:hypothetical protein